MNLINENIHKIKDLCKKYKVKNLYVFGSILTPRFNEKSDVDLLVNFYEEEIADPFINFFDLIYDLQDLLGRKVDLVDETFITNQTFKENLLANRKLIYG